VSPAGLGPVPFAPGGVSLRLYPHNELPADGIVSTFLTQAATASAAGFDGIMTSEHHAGFAGYLPNPIQAAGWALDVMPSGWAAAAPLLLPLRPAALVTEEVAWLAARYPGRVGVGVASGSLQADFDIMETTKDDLTPRFAAAMRSVSDALSGRSAGALAGDRAVARCVEHPVPMLSAANSLTAVRRAADCGVGLLFDSLNEVSRCQELIAAYRDAGGTASVVLIRRCWIGEKPEGRHQQQVDVYKTYSTTSAQSHWDAMAMVTGGAGEIAEQLQEALTQTGADALNLRVHVPGLEASLVTDQIAALTDVVHLLKS
jgi:alkanesulfonate monooxygenase SsuD/methylene tetrahydromethanopterin reductase-like flavin-dependent oxidoreductase (luciferase family)